jgi:hypothetical protein
MVRCGWGSVPTANTKQVHLSCRQNQRRHGQEDLAISIRCRFPANRDAQMPLLDSLDGIPPRILLGGNRTADSMVGPAGTKNYGRPSTAAAA